MGKAYWYTTDSGRSPVEEDINDLSMPTSQDLCIYQKARRIWIQTWRTFCQTH